MSRTHFSLLLGAILAAGQAKAGEGDSIKITDRFFHLGDTKHPDWKDLTTEDPINKTRLEIEFEGKENPKNLVLEVEAGGVAFDWKVKLNEKQLGGLRKTDALTAQYFQVEPFTLINGKNRLFVTADKPGDDIYVGKATLYDRPLREVMGLARVKVVVRDKDSGESLPSRLTVVRPVEKKEKDKTKVVEELVDIFLKSDNDLAVRKGIIYTKNGLVAFDLVPGNYTIYATRGFEYGLATARVHLGRLEDLQLELELRREVDTTGYLAADSHIHTRTYSGHGDINLEERVITIAGEGIEVAIATDHNHHTDYAPTMQKVAIEDKFRALVGNEVTTPVGHFNAFPFDKEARPPDHEYTDWVKLVQAMRAGSGVRVIILNHPRRPMTQKSPLESIKYNPLSGEVHDGPRSLGVDAVEVLNAKTLNDDRLLTFKDWFGLLNRGYRIAAVAGSDSHAVDDIVGQARTYVVSSTDDPRKLQIPEICDNYLAGRLLTCLGLLAEVEVNGKYRVGDLATGLKDTLDVTIKVQGPSWTRADQVALYLNGVEVKKEKIEPSERPVKYEATWQIPTPAHDAHLVVIASGPPITAPYWPLTEGEKKYVTGATNPVWIDGDGDGKFTSAFEYASRVVEAHGFEADEAELSKYDPAVSAQFASLARANVEKEAQEAYDRLLGEADKKLAHFLNVKEGAVKKGLSDYLAAAPKIEVRTRRQSEEEAARSKKEDEDAAKRKEAEEKKRREEEKRKAEAKKKADEKGEEPRRPPRGQRV